MRYEEIQLIGGSKVQIDFDAKQTACKGCGKLIRFGITKNGKYIPVIELAPGHWQAHFADCEKASQFRKPNTQEEVDRNQDYLNSL